MKNDLKIQDRTGTGMNITNYSNNSRIHNSIENCVGNSYLSDIKKNSNEDSNSDVRIKR